MTATPTTCLLDGFGPVPLVRPGCAADVGDLIRQAAASNGAVYPVGGQTKIGMGNPPSKPGQAVDMRGLCEVIDFPARDMTITVQAGITIAVLRETLAREKLRLPIDVPQADRATLGGILACNTSGPRRLGYGTLRDYVIGVTALNDEGREFKAGGRVVKNVAGYDLCKLLVGSLGTLGVITQATLKLRPIAEQQALISIPCGTGKLDALQTTLRESRTRPTCVDLLNRAAAAVVCSHAGIAAPDAPWVVIVGYEGNDDAVLWQVQQIIKEVKVQHRLDARVDFTATPLWDALAELSASTPTVFKANLLPSGVLKFCQHVGGDVNPPALLAHAGSGIVYGHWSGDLAVMDAVRILSTWRHEAEEACGNVIVASCPIAWKPGIDVWGPPPESVVLMREIKAKFDPKRVFNPGRFLGGI